MFFEIMTKKAVDVQVGEEMMKNRDVLGETANCYVGVSRLLIGSPLLCHGSHDSLTPPKSLRLHSNQKKPDICSGLLLRFGS